MGRWRIGAPMNRLDVIFVITVDGNEQVTFQGICPALFIMSPFFHSGLVDRCNSDCESKVGLVNLHKSY